MNDFDSYHVDPKTARNDAVGNRAGRYPKNFVAFPWFLRPLNWGDALSRLLTGQPAYRVNDSLLKRFDAVNAPPERWGSATEIEALRRNLVLLGKSFDANPYRSPIGRVLGKTINKAYLKNRAATIAFFEANREFIEANGRIRAPVIVTGFMRTGSTLLHRLMCEDPNTRAPYLYELEAPVPPLKAGADPLCDPRIENSAAAMAVFSKLMPGMREKLSESHPGRPLNSKSPSSICNSTTG